MEAETVAVAVRGNADALAFLRAMARVLHCWDDLIDQDKEVTDETINGCMSSALLEIPLNPFYREHIDVLAPVLSLAIINWRIATGIERDPSTSKDDLLWAFVIRSTYLDLVTMCAQIIGGSEHAIACGPELRRWAHAETFIGYLKNLDAEFRARKEKQCAVTAAQ